MASETFLGLCAKEYLPQNVVLGKGLHACDLFLFSFKKIFPFLETTRIGTISATYYANVWASFYSCESDFPFKDLLTLNVVFATF